jgi:ATP-dependent Clp protease ATP-binding subunit ClpC
MTSNIGARQIQKRGNLGFQLGSDTSREKLVEQVMSQVKQTFAPEFINRLDEVIIFDELNTEDLQAIIELQLTNLNTMLSSRSLSVTMTGDARDWLIEKTCADRSYGARPLKRALQRYVEDELSEALIQGDITEESEVEIVLKDDKLAFREVLPAVFEQRLITAP